MHVCVPPVCHELVRWMRSQEHLLLLQRSGLQFPVLSWKLTAHNSSSSISDILFCLPEAPQSHIYTLDVGSHTLKCLFKKDQRKAEERRRKKWKDGEEGAVREEWLPRTAQLSAEDLSFTQKQSRLLLFYFYFIQAWIVCVCLTEYSFHIPSS